MHENVFVFNCVLILVMFREVETFTEYPPLGRFAVRDMKQTVAVGVIKVLLLLLHTPHPSARYISHIHTHPHTSALHPSHMLQTMYLYLEEVFNRVECILLCSSHKMWYFFVVEGGHQEGSRCRWRKDRCRCPLCGCEGTRQVNFFSIGRKTASRF